MLNCPSGIFLPRNEESVLVMQQSKRKNEEEMDK